MHCVVLESNYFIIIGKNPISLHASFSHFSALVNIHHEHLLNFIHFIIITLVTVT